MKKIIVSTFLLFTAAFIISGCRKSDNPKLPELVRFPTPKLTKDPSAGQTIVASNAANFTGKVIVEMMFAGDTPPQKYDLVVRKNGTTVRTLQANITSFPTTVTFTGTQLSTLFGQSVATCDFFDFGVDVTTQSGQTYYAFPVDGGNAYASGIASQPGASTSVRYATRVEFVPADYSGNFTVVSDAFGDFAPGSTVALTPINATSFSFKSPQVANSLPIVVTVDPNTLLATIARQKIGDYFLWETSYTNVFVEASGSSSNVVPCTKTLNLNLEYSVDQGSFSPYMLVLRKP